jgi:death-on-curing protein
VTTYLSAQEVLFIHARLIAETGGEHGVLNVGLLESAVARPRATFDGVDLYSTLFDKAAALMESLILNHPFIDGNKRVAIAAAALFLRRNGYRMTPDNRELERFTLAVVNNKLLLEEVAAWFTNHTTPTERL